MIVNLLLSIMRIKGKQGGYLNLIDLDIKDDLLHFNISLQRRVSFIMGDSDTGKTSLYGLLERKLAENDEEVSMQRNIDIVLLNFSNLNLKCSHVLYVVDDLDIFSSNDFKELLSYIEDRDLWFLIMSREDVEFDKNLSCKYKFISDNNIYTLSHM